MGGPAANITAVMTNQVDVGWSAPPFGLDQLDKGDIRMIATGNDAAIFNGQTVRVNIANANWLKATRTSSSATWRAYRETVDFMYQRPEGDRDLLQLAQYHAAKAKRTRDEFFKSPAIDPDKIVGLNQIAKDAVELKFTEKPLTNEQLADLIRIPARK